MMSSDPEVEIPFAGTQSSFKLSASSLSCPDSFLNFPADNREKLCAAWRACSRLKSLTELWSYFLLFGSRGQRIDEQTEDNVTQLFPELASLGSVLNYFALRVEPEADVCAAIREIEQECRITRGPTASHQQDNPREVRRKIQPLLKSFRELIRTEVDCLHRLGIHEQFRRNWGELRREVEQLLAIDADWSDEITLDFGAAFSNRAASRIRGVWKQAAEDSLAQLQSYPEVAFKEAAQTSELATAVDRPEPKVSQLSPHGCDDPDSVTLDNLPIADYKPPAKRAFPPLGKADLIPNGQVFKLLRHMWERDTSDYDSLAEPVFDSDPSPSMIRSLLNKANRTLRKIGEVWTLHSDSIARVVTKRICRNS